MNIKYVYEMILVWKNAFLKGSDWSNWNFECITDDLDGICVGTDNNYAKTLFDQLSSTEKDELASMLYLYHDDIVYIDFEKLYIVYSLKD